MRVDGDERGHSVILPVVLGVVRVFSRFRPRRVVGPLVYQLTSIQAPPPKHPSVGHGSKERLRVVLTGRYLNREAREAISSLYRQIAPTAS